MKTHQITATPSQIIIEQLVTSNVKYLFYNSGSKEALFFDALHNNPNINGVLALHEGSVTAMAGGYSQVHSDPAVMLVHLGAGLAQCMGQLINVCFGGLPVVVITFAGDTGSWVDRTHSLDLDSSFGPTSISAPLTKASWTIIDPQGLPHAIDRALKVAKTPPFGPVHLAVYDRVLENTQITTNIIEPSNSNIRPNRASDKDLNTVLSYLDQAKRPMIYAGDGIWKSGGELSASKLATYFGAAVVTTDTDHRGISIKHPQHMGKINTAIEKFNPDLLLSIGVRHQGQGVHSDLNLLNNIDMTIALGSDLDNMRNYPGLEHGIIGDEKSSIERMISLIPNLQDEQYSVRRQQTLTIAEKWRQTRRQDMMPAYKKNKVRPGLVIDAIDETLESMGGGIVTNEQFAASHEALLPGINANNNSYLRAAGGSEGWGVGAAIGAKLAAEDVPVVGFVGDGSLYYADSGLWTASHHNIPLLYVITNNGAYGIVANAFERAGGQMSDTGEYGGVVLDDINPLKIANSYGIDGERLDNEDKVKETIKRALDIVQNENRPYLLDVRMPLGLPSKGKAMKQFLMKERKN